MADKPAPEAPEAGAGAAAPAPRRGALNLLTIIARGVAVLALALSAVLFMQLSKAQGALKHAALPAGLKDDSGATDDQSKQGTPALMSEPQEVTYELGDFTANSADGKFVKMNLALKVKSFYQQDDWDNYQFQLDQYNKQRQDYFDYQKKQSSGDGKSKADLEPQRAPAAAGVTLAGYARGGPPTGAIPAAEEGKKEEAPTMPDKAPDRPLTRLEQAFKDSDAQVRSIIIGQINSHNAADLISEQGKADFKKKVMDALNAAFDSTLGSVEDMYFRDLVTT
jgi:flagellar basal body-associated protein FliL